MCDECVFGCVGPTFTNAELIIANNQIGVSYKTIKQFDCKVICTKKEIFFKYSQLTTVYSAFICTVSLFLLIKLLHIFALNTN